MSSYTENYEQCVKIITDAEIDGNGNRPRNYSFCYDKARYLARWVAYPMHSFYTSGDYNSKKFVDDPAFADEDVQIHDTYENGTVHNRGHQIAKAQRTVTYMARQQTNYYTNMTPQNGTLNGGKWAQLEEKERGQWMCNDTLYMVSGCHFDNYNTTVANKDGKTACPVPTHYFKVMLRTKNGNTGKRVADCSASELICAGYWVENSASGTPVLKSVAEIERLTGFTFFVNVPNAPKSSYTSSDWQ